jgi:hypothetical protein
MLTLLTRTFIAGNTPRRCISYDRANGNNGNEPVASDTPKQIQIDMFVFHSFEWKMRSMNLLNCNVLPDVVYSKLVTALVERDGS